MFAIRIPTVIPAVNKKQKSWCNLGAVLTDIVYSRFDGTSQTSQNVNPTHTVKDKLIIQEAGIELELYHAPGETSDQVAKSF